MRDLGALGDAFSARAVSISADGAIVVGNYRSRTTAGGPFVWTAATGAIDLRAYLRARGVDAGELRLGMATGISADGTAITGIGVQNDFARGYLISGLAFCRADSCPADFNCSAALEPHDILAFISAWFALDPRADFNGVSGITPQDIFDFLAAWFAGC